MQEYRRLISSDFDAAKGVQLWEHEIYGKTEYELVVNGVFLMASYNALSSELMVRNAIEKSQMQEGHILIGGLGLGYSVKEATKHTCLKVIDVVEINANVIHLNYAILEHVNGTYLKDPRVTVIHDDFIQYIRRADQQYDIICMDIDNGPMLITNSQNSEAYSHTFFRDVFNLLRGNGYFVVWSCERDDTILDIMAPIYSDVHVQEIFETHNDRSVPYYLYFASKK